MKTLKVLTIVAITGLAGTVVANACPKNGQKQAQCQTKQQNNKQDKCQKNKHQKHSSKKGEMKKIFKQLDLTSEQKMAMKSHRKGMKEQMKAKRGQMKAKRAQMHGERGMAGMSKFISANGFDKQGFMDMASKRSQNRTEMRANMFEQKMNILTSEQRVKLATLLQEK